MTRFHQFIRRKDDRFYKSGKETISAANACRRRRRLLRHDVGARARRLANLLRRTWTLDDPVSARIVQERLSILMILILAMIFIFFHVYGYARVLIPDFTATFWLQQPAAAISAANTCRRRLLRHDPGARARRLAELRRTTLMIDDPVSAQIG